MRLILIGNLSHAGLLEHLQKRRVQVATYQLALAQTAETSEERADLGNSWRSTMGWPWLLRNWLGWIARCPGCLSWLHRVKLHRAIPLWQ